VNFAIGGPVRVRHARRCPNMEVPPDHQVDEIKRLQRCINDLVSVLALPAIWTGSKPSQIASTLLDALLGMLRLDLVYVRLTDPNGDAPIEMVRMAESQIGPSSPHEIGEQINRWLGEGPETWPGLMRKSFGGRDISIVPFRLGLHREAGLLAAGSRSADFPRQTERLLLSVAANQAAIGLHEARLLSEQQRLADALDRRVAQRTRELAAANEELRLQVALLQHIPVAAWTVEPDGRPDFVNESWLEYTGQTLEYIRSEPEAWMTALHPEDRERASKSFAEGIRSGQGFTMEARFRRCRDGAYRWHLNRAVALRDPEGNILRFVGTVVDMHDWKQAQEELRNTQAELAHITRVMTMGELTASIAHEINQPLAGIITNAGTCLRMLAADPPNVDGARETARRTIRDGNRTSEIITRLRALYRKKDALIEAMDLNDATREVIALSLGDLQRHGVILQTELADDLPAVTGDRVQLQQVILNLVRNASDAMSGVDDRPRRLLIRSERDEGARVRLTVQDTGVGFDPQVVDKLCEAFYTTKADGMGMGLSVSRSIIESHHGRLWATLNDGPGASFAFSIPSVPDGATGAHDPIRAEAAR
jgi:PAS domain S-box-containing protein